MPKYHGVYGKPCICGCGRLAYIHPYATWHTDNPDPRLSVFCECGCGQLTSGVINPLTDVPYKRIWTHLIGNRKLASSVDCACGCGIKVSAPMLALGWRYASWHKTKGCEQLSVYCICGCGGRTSGKVDKAGEPVQSINFHSGASVSKGGRGIGHRTDIERIAEEVIKSLGLEYEF